MIFKVLTATVAVFSLAMPAHAEEWQTEVDLDRAEEIHTLQTDEATCRIGYGDHLMIEVVTKTGVVHKGYFMQNGRTPPGKPEAEGSPRRVFQLAGCSDVVPDIEVNEVRCLFMYVTTPYGPPDYERFRCQQNQE